MLVVDDEPNLRKICQRLIMRLGHECETAEDSEGAVALATSGTHFDLVLCDYRLAAETADVVVDGLSRHAPELVERTVIATGATTDPAVLQLSERTGVRLIAKPYGLEEITALVERVSRGEL